ncbi:hypothetical protein C5B94_03835 [Clavibacter michiganensis]|uniref:hypothetical protein n=1 Tax=Clavibacter michiganensis TaxID=28447 RepID=UPI000CE788F5|nr:hypothetical protein [Clavibacter michiganensis]PPF56060.1 hypothetical protein C5B94_03835 [Clavibacter michiganensis]
MQFRRISPFEGPNLSIPLALLVEETARLADAQETANLIAAFQTEGLLSPKERDSIHGRIGAALVDGRHG